MLNNASEAVGEDKRITLSYRSRPERREVVVEVADEGAGILPEELPHLFDPYYTTKATNHHLGLGLYYCYNVMEDHGGCIRVRSEPGKDSIFALLFPVKRYRRKGEKA